MRVPFEQPFVDPEIFEHPALVEFLERAPGQDYVWSHFDSNTPLPDTDYQHWHCDAPPTVAPGLMMPAFAVGAKFPLVDTNEENGSFEVIPCTQSIVEEDIGRNLDAVLGQGENRRGHCDPVRLNLKKSSLWVRDGRAIHRAPPIHSDHPGDLWQGLSDHARQVLRWQRVKDE